MSKITVEHNENSTISGFAYTTGLVIEEIIKQETNNLVNTNMLLQAQILGFLQRLDEPLKSKYIEYFDITANRR